MNKADIRKKMISLRDSLSNEEVANRSQMIEFRLMNLEAYIVAQVIFIYVSFGNEINTKGFINKAIKDGKRIAVPLTIPKGKLLKPCEISSLDDLTPSNWGILEPTEANCRLVHSNEIDLAVVPGLAFDYNFNRIGYGAGYYDRFLPSLPSRAVKLGIGYDFQLLDRLPVGKFDFPLDGVLTETKYCYKKH